MRGYHVVVLDSLFSGSINNVEFSGAEFVKGDVRNIDDLISASNGCNGIFHLAAIVSVQDCINNWRAGHETNAVGTINVFEVAKERKIPIVYASSAAIYGDPLGDICSEVSLPKPISPYGADKLNNEHHAHSYFAVHNIASFGLRFF